MTTSPNTCPCCSGLLYEQCCKPFHQGLLPKTALQLMRSRYAAYVLNLPEYIIATTHPASPQYLQDRKLWAQKISKFSTQSQFEKLEVLDFQESGSTAVVVFVAHVSQEKQDATFTEKSCFEKRNGKWLYRSGLLESGHAPNLVTTGQARLLPLAYYGNPILRKVADPVKEITDDIRKLVEEMIETMDACDGVGLAAPQIHHSIQLFVIRAPIEDAEGKCQPGAAKVFINPKLSKPGSEMWTVSEGCLSIPTIHADVERPEEITVEYMDLEGKIHKERCSGWEARIVMHENDHIRGVLFIDRLGKKERTKLEPFLKALQNRIHDGTEL